MRCLFFILIFVLGGKLFSGDVNFPEIFRDKDACFVLQDINKDKTELIYYLKRCEERFTPCSTFKIPLAVMAYDTGILKNEKEPLIKWDGKMSFLAEWNSDQTPESWEKYSVVWVSQRITPKIGLDKINTYLKDFKYGNCDMSGGLTSAWLSSTLQISALEQIDFLKRLWTGKLDVSSGAIAFAKAVIPSERFDFGEIKGKTGSGTLSEKTRIGWFIGYFTAGEKHYVFALNFSDDDTLSPGGYEAKKMLIEILNCYVK